MRRHAPHRAHVHRSRLTPVLRAAESVLCTRKVRMGTHSARACLLADTPARAFTCPRMPCAPDPVGRSGVGCTTGPCVLSPRQCVVLQRHTGMPPVSRCQFHALSFTGYATSESGGRFVLRRRRRCPVGLFPACLMPGGDRASSAPDLYLACPSEGLAPTRAAREGRA